MATTRTLTPKQENFCLAYLETGNASEAYRRAYDAERMKAETIAKRAHELLGNGKITGMLNQLRKPVVEAAGVTFEGHVQKLAELRDKALELGQISAAVTAEAHRGKVAGLYVEKTEAVVQNFVVRTPAKSESVEEWTAEHSPTMQ